MYLREIKHVFFGERFSSLIWWVRRKSFTFLGIDSVRNFQRIMSRTFRKNAQITLQFYDCNVNFLEEM